MKEPRQCEQTLDFSQTLPSPILSVAGSFVVGLKTSHPSHQPLPVCALRKLAGFADKSTFVAPTQTQTRDTPLVPFNEAGASSSATGATAKTRSRPSNEYVLYAYGEPVAMTADGNASYFGTDILGSVRSVTDKYGNVQSNYNYDVFGAPYLSNLDNDMSFGYCGKTYDNGTGLYNYGFRDYSPNQARFTTIDPIRDGNNWFAYVVNDPVNYIDPFGLTSTDSGSGKPTNTNPANNNAPNEPSTGTNDSPSTPADTETPTQPAPTAPAPEAPAPEASAPTVPTPSVPSAPPVSTGNLSSPTNAEARIQSNYWNNFSVESAPLKNLVASQGKTYCNGFLPRFFNGLGEKVYNDIMPTGKDAAISALELAIYFETNPNLRCLNIENNQRESSVLAQEAANRGALVIAFSKGSTNYGPHVAIVAPQNSVYHSLPQRPEYEGTSGGIAHDQGVKNPVADRDFPVFLQAGAYTGFVPPGYAFSREMFNENTVKYYIYEPKE